MTAVQEMLDAAKKGAGVPSDNVLSQKLGITRAVISAWRNGLYPVPDERIAQICEIAKLDGPMWTARLHAERATSPAERKMWRLALDRLSAVAAVLVLAVFAAPGAARAKAVDSEGFSGSDQPHSVYYVRSLSEDARVPLASITGLAMPSQEASVPLAAWQLRLSPSSDQGLVHDPSDPAADQAAPRDNDLFL
ncbi:DUF3693 domain-containing protein [Stenotrophomonas sp. GD03819]|uniref:DUF3693 domain-containing protein n=1 Tax=Stenotrophomonas sp. GD03819 TaxID=2975384 RepID=UPI00244C8FFA|nr:DUF3693 domain-containing protein [Stenotrophomonas sp. GD03819]MDH1790575.1 DUF3693 domain-containing protein [Stenotrophomonas sp. GD03819]